MNFKIAACIILFFVSSVSFGQNEIDQFARIGNMVSATRLNLLEEKVPAPLPEKYLPVTNNKKAVFRPIHSMNTKEELYEELAKYREKYMPFLKDLAPKLDPRRIRVPLSEFNWRVETEEDRKDFGSTLNGKGEWEKVSIPHFGPPLGRAVTYYRTVFNVTPEMMKKGSVFAVFKAVDYKASVFINGAYAGSHEGMFAPFEFNITGFVNTGDNVIVVKVENDYKTTGDKDDKGERVFGDKIFGATGIGYDDPAVGWHKPEGMGIYQVCFIEARDKLHINDIFVRPLPEKEKAEIWLEINNYHKYYEDVKVRLAVYGQNFEENTVEEFEYIPETVVVPGVGDLAKPDDWKHKKLQMGYGTNFLKLTVDIKNPRLWNNSHPWLYQVQVKLLDKDDKITDTRSRQFGMRSFTMDTVNVPRGKMYLNGEFIRLRGANTMGFMQVDVSKKDWDQLIDDILLAKICNLNFFRLTQRPVQPEIYEYCDRLGMMTQTDLPLFGVLRPNKWAEAVKQAEEMERLVRSHPCNIMVTYINERFPNGEGYPQRNIYEAEDYMMLFKACDQAVHMANPDRVIKAGDGDYDPPSPGLPDNHCYNCWYNGHALGIGEMHKGYWMPVKPGWFYGCGEFGAEGLDPRNVMEKYYPEDWLPASEKDEASWTANRIAFAQTQRFHYMWFNTQHTLDDWIEASQDHQAWATRMYTEAFRRNPDMVSFAIHLFIDAWPAGWMKTIMDVDRQPKKSFFVYRDALKPLMANLRTDRYMFFSGEEMNVEAWLCNDLNEVPENYTLKYQLEKGKKVIFANEIKADFAENSSRFQGFIKKKLPEVNKRTGYKLRLGLFDDKGNGISQSVIDIDVFPGVKETPQNVYAFSSDAGKAVLLLEELNGKNEADMKNASTIIVDDFDRYEQNKAEIDELVKAGRTVVFLELPQGEYSIGDSKINVENTVMGSYYFASPTTGHEIVKDNKPMDFKFWYEEEKGMAEPFLSAIFTGEDWVPVLASGSTNWVGDKGDAFAVAEMNYGKGKFRVCEIQLDHRLQTNPVARIFALRLLK